jgi:imidazolonepropionase-like amidohydrolase
MSLVISGATILDGVADRAIEGRSILIEGARIRAIGRPDEIGSPAGAKVIDARGKYLIAGLMNANVHLLSDVRLEVLARYIDRYEELIAEAAQVALKNGVTTVFDTWGPRRYLTAVRDRIEAGELPGSRIFLAGNIVGFDGPFSADFFEKAAEVASATLVKRIDAIWVEGVGRHLMWLTPEEVARHVREHIAKGIDFVKYGSNQHGSDPGAFLAFSPQAQAAIVGEAHQAGITAQAHTHTVEGLRIAIEAGCDLIQHANLTGPVAIPETTLDGICERKVGAVIFPYTERGLNWIDRNSSAAVRKYLQAADLNARSLIRCGARILLATDGSVFAPEAVSDPKWGRWLAEESVGLLPMDTGHFYWLRAMEEKGFAPMEMLKAATRNVAVAYGKDKDLGTLEPGKIADLLILDRDPLQSAENYRSIHLIVKEGVAVDRDVLPLKRILTPSMELPPEEEAARASSSASNAGVPTWPMCMCGRA